MHKRHTQTPIQASYNLDNEVNVKEYPYYRNIPIESIAERQQQMLQQYNSVAVCNTSVTPFAPFAPITSVESLYEEQKEQKEQREQREQREQPLYTKPPPPSPLPVLHLIKIPGENMYRVDIRTMEKKLEDLQREINENTEKLSEQRRAIVLNEESIQKQNHTINKQNNTIQNNVIYIQHQLQAYNYNVEIIHQQVYTYESNNTYIESQKETLNSLQTQILECEEQNKKTYQETEAQQKQITYQKTMLSAFSTMINNPEYFTELISLSLRS
jgi:hypothetical protein